MIMKEKFLYLNSEDVRKCLVPGMADKIVEYLWKHWKDGSVMEGEHAFLPAGHIQGNEFLYMPVCLPKLGVLGFKWINCYMNPAPGYPFSHGNLIALNDIETGSLLSIISASDITAMRTAGGHGVTASRYLAKKPVQRLAIIGSGSQAMRGIEGFLAAFSELKTIRVHCRSRVAFDKLKDRFMDKVCIQYVENCSQIGKNVDVILAATSSPSVLLRYEYLEKGTTVIALDGFIDVDPSLSYKADKWYVGNLKSDVLEIIDSGVMSQGEKLDSGKIFGELPDVVSGKIPGRENKDEIIVYTHMGSGAYDVACAYEVYRKAREDGSGLELEL